MPYTVSARADQARERAQDLLILLGLTPVTARQLAKRLSWALARAICRELEPLLAARKEPS